MLALVLALSITPSVFAEETVGSTTNNVDAINGDDTQDGVGTTTDKAYKTEETVGGTTNNVDAINGDDTPEETVGGTTIYVDANNGDDAQEGVGTAKEKAYKSIGEAVKAAKSGYTIKLAKGNYSLYEVCGKQGTNNAEYTKNKDLKKPSGASVRRYRTRKISARNITATTVSTVAILRKKRKL